MNHQVVHTIVFAMEKGGGNPCPVVLQADDLTAETMQQMTKDFGHESVFVLKPEHSDCDIKLRYFVPAHEMEMCIHATIGSITVLVNRNILTTSPIKVETALGPVNVEWKRNGSALDISVEQFPPQFIDDIPSKETVGKALKITPEEIDEWPVQSVSTSRSKLVVALKSTHVLHRLEPDFEYLWQVCDEFNTTGFYPFAVEEQSSRSVQARQFPKRAGYPEDPATGTAASALSAYLTKHEYFSPLQEGWNSFMVMQGAAMGKASFIQPETFIHENKITGARVKGNAVEV